MPLFVLIDNASGNVDLTARDRWPVAGAKTWVDASGVSPPPSRGWTYAAGAYAPPAAPAPAPAALRAYAAAKAAAALGTMRRYGPVSPGGFVLEADATSETLADLQLLTDDAATAPADPVSWLANDDTVTATTAGQIAALAPLVGAYRKTVFATRGAAVTGVASGAITTTAQIDALAWPV